MILQKSRHRHVWRQHIRRSTTIDLQIQTSSHMEKQRVENDSFVNSKLLLLHASTASNCNFLYPKAFQQYLKWSASCTKKRATFIIPGRVEHAFIEILMPAHGLSFSGHFLIAGLSSNIWCTGGTSEDMSFLVLQTTLKQKDTQNKLWV